MAAPKEHAHAPFLTQMTVLVGNLSFQSVTNHYERPCRKEERGKFKLKIFLAILFSYILVFRDFQGLLNHFKSNLLGKSQLLALVSLEGLKGTIL